MLILCATQPGRERALAFQLMRKFFAAGPQELRLISVVARDDVKGFIYVEAARAADVQQGCAKLNGLYSLKPQIIDLDEMIGALTVKKVEVKSVSQNQFVRLKKGKYSGDLAQVMSVDESRGTAVVRCIPRIDLQALKSEGRVRILYSVIGPWLTPVRYRRRPSASAASVLRKKCSIQRRSCTHHSH